MNHLLIQEPLVQKQSGAQCCEVEFIDKDTNKVFLARRICKSLIGKQGSKRRYE